MERKESLRTAVNSSGNDQEAFFLRLRIRRVGEKFIDEESLLFLIRSPFSKLSQRGFLFSSANPWPSSVVIERDQLLAKASELPFPTLSSSDPDRGVQSSAFVAGWMGSSIFHSIPTSPFGRKCRSTYCQNKTF